MDKLWDRNPSKSEVIDRCGGDETTRMATQNRHKSNAKKKKTTYSVALSNQSGTHPSPVDYTPP